METSENKERVAQTEGKQDTERARGGGDVSCKALEEEMKAPESEGIRQPQAKTNN